MCQVCATHQKSLVYIEFNSLNINYTALKELSLLRSQVLVGGWVVPVSNVLIKNISDFWSKTFQHRHHHLIISSFCQVSCTFAYIDLLSSDIYQFMPQVQKCTSMKFHTAKHVPVEDQRWLYCAVAGGIAWSKSIPEQQLYLCLGYMQEGWTSKIIETSYFLVTSPRLRHIISGEM